MKKIAFVTGVTGQDGSYLSNFYLTKTTLFMDLNEDHH